jgi:hypothetical protein
MQGEGVAHHWQPLTPALSLSRGEGFNCRDAGLLKKKLSSAMTRLSDSF